MSTTLMVVSIIVLFFVLALFVAYMFYLRRHFLAVCRETKQLQMFAQAPAGLPACWPVRLRSIGVGMSTTIASLIAN